MPRAEVWRGIFILPSENTAVTERACQDATRGEPLQREGEDFQVALAGQDYGQEAAVGGNVKFAEREAVEDGLRRGREDGNFRARFLRGQRGNVDPD